MRKSMQHLIVERWRQSLQASTSLLSPETEEPYTPPHIAPGQPEIHVPGTARSSGDEPGERLHPEVPPAPRPREVPPPPHEVPHHDPERARFR